MSENSNGHYLYAVICFLKKNKKKKSQVDLIPSSWIVKVDENNIFCKYPPKEDYNLIPEWLTLLKGPEDDWNLFPITIISYARDLEQGNRRLDRAYIKNDVKSTDDESAVCDDISKKSQPRSMAEIKRKIKPLSSTSQLSPISETISDESIQQTEKNHHSTTVEVQKIIASTNKKYDQFVSDDIEHSHPDLALLKDYIDARCSKMTEELRTQLFSIKRSLQYDLKEKNNELKHTLIVNTNTQGPSMSVSDARKALGVSLPLMQIEDFLKFEDLLKNSEEKQNALKTLYRILIFGEITVTTCIKKIMLATVDKQIELEYSGTGKKNKKAISTKRDFSATQTFTCLQDVIVEKFGDKEEVKNLPGKVGRWLSGANDRGGGRKQR
ncbi:uncharacterized protein Grip71 [Chelonus insularis]|uniref:uncharacterized protein Grip71 n=1 Tax=Chelonus insularis TaxID=460826 RepID=UPI00158B5FE1|nr:uncharacterized protein LOC118071086 [Chelonus insularis]